MSLDHAPTLYFHAGAAPPAPVVKAPPPVEEHSLAKVLLPLPRIDPKVAKQIELAHRQLTKGRRFMSFDVERLPSGQFHEIGITLLRHGRMESFNYRLRGIERGPQFVFGKTIEADFDIISNLVRMHAATADFYIGHSILADLKHLEEEGIEMPERFRYDTALWGKGIFGHTPKLYDMAKHYGAGLVQFHCGGNDARYTAEVFQKIAHTHHEEASHLLHA